MKLTPERLSAFCAALAETGIVARACAAVGISRQTAYEWREEIPEFAEAWGRALKIGVTALEDECHRRGFEGTDEPVFHLGEQVATVKKYSDTLAIFLLKAHNPEKYRERHGYEVAGPGGAPLTATDDTTLATRIAAILAIAKERQGGSTAPAEIAAEIDTYGLA